MFYLSTRGQVPAASFTDVLLQGPAPDGGLYLPEHYPQIDATALRDLARLPYADAAVRILQPFVGDDLPADLFTESVHRAYAGFTHPQVAPLRALSPGVQLLELFHGPTLAFKDIALQLLGTLTDAVLRRRGERITVLGATSGDTGPAAIAGFAGCEYADVFILYPHGCPSQVQRRQMTTRPEARVHALAIEGTFDDCQRIVKALFADADFRTQARLTAVNSLNWVRIAAQSVYYVLATAALGAGTAFAVPTGNFGNLFAAYTARRMGVPLGRLIIGTNANDILYRTVRAGTHHPTHVQQTAAPAMDIQIASNFERMLFELADRDPARVRAAMRTPEYHLTPAELHALQSFCSAERVDDAAIAASMRRVYDETGVIIDPHTAIGVEAARRTALPDVTTVCLACAHPAKFPETVGAVLGRTPDEPQSVRALAGLQERFTVLPADVAAVRAFISRAQG